jgi:hypothetical protein
MAKVQAKAWAMRFLFSATCQYNPDLWSNSSIPVSMNLLGQLFMKSQWHKHSSVHYFFTSANHKATSFAGTASVHEFAHSASHKATSLTDMTVCMKLSVLTIMKLLI